VEDVNLDRIFWHRIPGLPGPHLLAYCWWFVANQLWRWWHRTLGSLTFDLIYTPGVNCLDADVVSVHAVFSEFYRRVQSSLKLRANPVRTWPLILHRRLYYQLIMALERRVYGGKNVVLTPVSAKVGRALESYRSGTDNLPANGEGQGGRARSPFHVIVNGIEPERFNPESRRRLRIWARRELSLTEWDFCVLLVGNDWKSKGLPCLIEALGKLEVPTVRLLVVGHDTAEPYRAALARLRLEDRTTFLPLRRDVEFCYAAADVYAGPSLEDAFGMPPLEAMACGLPVITSSQNGVCEVMTDGVDGFLLEDPRDSDKLAELILRLYKDPGLCQKLGQAAAITAKKYTWDLNAQQLDQVFRQILRTKALTSPVLRARDVRHSSAPVTNSKVQNRKSKSAGVKNC
jgi:glycosyltransferase involved in cell wall biosynthesis